MYKWGENETVRMGGLVSVRLESPVTQRALLERFFGYAMAFLGVVLLGHFTVAVSVILILTLVATAVETKVSPSFFLLVGIVMPSIEIAAVHFGDSTWTYVKGDVLGVPLWLFPLWALVGQWILDLYALAIWLEQRWVRTKVITDESM